MQIKLLLDEVTGVVTSEPLKLERWRQKESGNIPIQVFGTFVGTVTLEATMSHTDIDMAVRDDTAVWSPVANGEFTEPVADSLMVAFTYVRAVADVTGSVSVAMDI